MIKKADGTNYDLGAINTSSSETTSSSTLSESTTSTTSTSGDEVLFSLEYTALGIDGQNGVSLDFQYWKNYVDFSLDLIWTKHFDNFVLRYKLGALLGYWIEDVFYISGCAGAFIGFNDKDFAYGLFLTPRIAIKFGESFCLTGSWRYDFNEFKFKEAYNVDYFSVGIGFTF